MKKIILTVLLMFISTTVTLGQEEWELPRSWQERDLRPIDKVEMLKELTKDSIEKLQKGKLGFLAGIARIVDYNIDNSGQWDTLKDGSLLWRIAIRCQNAVETNVEFNKFYIPKGAKVYVYGYDQMRRDRFYKHYNQIFDESYNMTDSSLNIVSFLMRTDTIVVEYYIPPYTKEKGNLSITSVGDIFGYRDSGYINVGTKRNEEI